VEPFAWAILLKPFVAVVLFAVVWLLARSIYRLIPNGRIRDVLYDKTLRERHPWRFGALILFFYLAIGAGLWAVWG
jgi:hypothetical protein